MPTMTITVEFDHEEDRAAIRDEVSGSIADARDSHIRGFDGLSVDFDEETAGAAGDEDEED